MGNADLPVASGKQHVAAFQRAGWELLARRGRGKHYLLKKKGHIGLISIPDHGEVKRALLAAQLKNAGISIRDYLQYFNRR